MTKFFLSLPDAPVVVLARRLRLAKSALAQAESDLNAARAREGLGPAGPDDDDDDDDAAARRAQASTGPQRAPTYRSAQNADLIGGDLRREWPKSSRR